MCVAAYSEKSLAGALQGPWKCELGRELLTLLHQQQDDA